MVLKLCGWPLNGYVFLGKINDTHNSPVDLGVPCFHNNTPTKIPLSIYEVVSPVNKNTVGWRFQPTNATTHGDLVPPFNHGNDKIKGGT